MEYLQFKMPHDKQPDQRDSFFLKTINWILDKIMPDHPANPDYDGILNDINTWLIEFDDTGLPNREIGLDADNNVLAKMPYKKNYGYWTDNNLLADDFKKRFNISYIDPAIFEARWKEI